MQTFLQSILLLFSIGKIFINQGFKRHREANEKTLSHVPLFFLKWHIYANTNRNVAITFVVTLLTVMSRHFRHHTGKMVLEKKFFEQID